MIPGGYYHVTCRGNERKAIFPDDTDRVDFLEKLRGSLAIYQVELHAYVLMSNHFHLMVATPRGNLSEFMRHFNISYTAAYNRRHKRVATCIKSDMELRGRTRNLELLILIVSASLADAA